MVAAELTAARVLELLDIFAIPPTWRVENGHAHAGDVAGGLHAKTGYWRIGIDRRRYQAHRLVWLAAHGEWPKDEIDHINGNRSDNRLENLRDVKSAVNKQNQRRARADNESCGLLGVSRNGKRSWSASLMSGRRHHYLGTFSTPEEAHAAYIEAKRRLHPGGML